MILTKADVYEKTIFTERPFCPHCGERMKIWECEDSGFGCGSGWGTPYLFVCFNDECSAFVNGWDNMMKNYGRKCSYRCICFPDSGVKELMMVFSMHDGKSGILDEAKIAVDKKKGTDVDPLVQALMKNFEARDAETLLSNIFNAKMHHKVRQKAAALIGELGLVKTIEPLRNYKFKDQRVLASVHTAIDRIHQINATRECPFCFEIIAQRSKKCSECGKDLQ